MIITLAWEQIPIFSLCYEATWDKNNYKILFRSTESLDALVKTENFQMEISVYSSILSTYYFWTMKHANMHKNYKSVKCKVDLRISTFVWGERRSETLTGTWRKKKKEIQETCQFLLPSYFADCLQRQTAILFHYVGFLN